MNIIPRTKFDFSQSLNQLKPQNLSNDGIFFLHLLLAAFLFSNFFLFNQILIYSTDVLNINYPLLIFAKRNFLEGNLGLWNPYLISGIPSFASSNTPIWSIDNWPHFLFPEKYFFLVGTFLSFIKLWLLGVFSFLLFDRELEDKNWAFFSSIIYQFSGYSIWALLVNDVLSLELFLTIALYIIWSSSSRRTYLNYMFLVFSLYLVLFSSNVSYGVHAIILTGVLFIYRFYSTNSVDRKSRVVLSFALAFITAIVLGVVKIVPAWLEAQDSNRILSFSQDLRDASFLVLRLFNPEIFGVFFGNSEKIFSTMAPFFNGMHTHWAMPHYFGVLAALLVVWAIFSPLKGKINFWVIYVLFVMGVILFIEPFETLMKFFNPGFHSVSLQIWLPVGFCILAGYAGKNIEGSTDWVSTFNKQMLWVVFVGITMFAYMFVVGLTLYQDKIGLIRVVAGAGVLAGSMTFLLLKRNSNWVKYIIGLFAGLILTYLFAELALIPRSNATYSSHTKILSTILLLLMGISLIVYNLIQKKYALPSHLNTICLLFLLILMGVAIYPWAPGIKDILSLREVKHLMLLGGLKFIVIFSLFCGIFHALYKKRFESKWVFPIFILITICELVPASKIHSHIVLNPFNENSNPYPPLTNQVNRKTVESVEFDSRNYRVNYPNSLLKIPFYRQLYGEEQEVLSSAFSVYKIRSYGGHYNMIPKRYETFIKTMIPDLADGEVGYGVYTRINDPRFLDLSGVGHQYENSPESGLAGLRRRPNALSRFMLFESFEIIKDEGKALNRLKSLEFDPLKAIVLGQAPGIESASPESARKITEFKEISTDEIELNISNEVSGVLFFGDSYHEGWKAFVNGVETPVVQANYNFMATTVPAGTNKIIFKFRPAVFTYCLYIAIAGLVFFVSTSFVLYALRNRFDPGFQN